MPIRVTIWNEFMHERTNAAVKAIYPDGLHATIRSAVQDDEVIVTLAALDDPDQGLPDSLLDNTDVLMWWGHMRHGDVDDGLVKRIVNRVYNHGMGFIALHSAHMSKPFRALVGTSGNLQWGDDQREILWTLMPSHDIAKGIPDHIDLELEEMYGEPFMIPQPDELIFAGWFKHGNLFRSGCTFYRGLGKIFYFQPGHEACRSYHNPYIHTILRNAIRWAAPGDFSALSLYPSSCPYSKKLVP